MHPARRMSFFLILEQINTDRIPKAKKYFVNVHLLYTFLKKILVGIYIYVSYRGRFIYILCHSGADNTGGTCFILGGRGVRQTEFDFYSDFVYNLTMSMSE